jgi:hypothetical protein
MGADAMKLPASSARITVLLERESAIVLILDLFWFPGPVDPDPPDVLFDESEYATENQH